MLAMFHKQRIILSHALKKRLHQRPDKCYADRRHNGESYSIILWKYLITNEFCMYDDNLYIMP